MREVAPLMSKLGIRLSAFAGCAMLASGLAALGLALWLGGLATPDCVGLLETGYSPAQEQACAGLVAFHDLRGLADPLGAFVDVLAPVTGIVLGAELVAGELDAGMLQLAWTLEPTRRRWPAEPLLVGGPGVGAVGLVAAILSTPLAAAEHLDVDLTRSFVAYGGWGPLLPLRGLAAFAIGVLAGAVVGRSVPTLLVAALTAMVFIFGALVLARASYPAELASGTVARDALVVSVGEVGADGRFVSRDAALARAPASLSEPDRYAWLDAQYQAATTYIPGSDMPAVAVREAALLVAVAIVAIGASALVVDRRRPL